MGMALSLVLHGSTIPSAASSWALRSANLPEAASSAPAEVFTSWAVQVCASWRAALDGNQQQQSIFQVRLAVLSWPNQRALQG